MIVRGIPRVWACPYFSACFHPLAAVDDRFILSDDFRTSLRRNRVVSLRKFTNRLPTELRRVLAACHLNKLWRLCGQAWREFASRVNVNSILEHLIVVGFGQFPLNWCVEKRVSCVNNVLRAKKFIFGWLLFARFLFVPIIVRQF